MMKRYSDKKFFSGIVGIVFVLVIFLLVLSFAPKSGNAAVMVSDNPSEASISETSQSVYLPLLMKNYPWPSPFGIETQQYLIDGSDYLTRTVNLDVRWARLNGKISWKSLQPNQGDPIDWGKLSQFEDELRALRAAGITPVIVVDDSPHWAVIPYLVGDVETYSSCAAIKTEFLDDYAAFLGALVERYHTPEFNVHHWELGNEPDVDPRLIPADYPFGCWGDIEDPFYGGRHYGEMIKVVSPVIKAKDPTATVWVGGLLLDNPNTDPVKGRPELFLQGILEAGAAPYFDIVGYHAYPGYIGTNIDYDAGWVWEPWGGNTRGKASFLRSIMDQYGVDIPVFLNETGLMCPDHGDYKEYCLPPVEGFYQAQADHIVRSFTRGLSVDIMGFNWYTLEDQWRYTGLLDSANDPKKVYFAYQHLTTRLENSKYLGIIDYGADIEAYAFQIGAIDTHVVWVTDDQDLTILVPQADFVEAYSVYGDIILPTVSVGDNYQLDVGFSPIYVIVNH